MSEQGSIDRRAPLSSLLNRWAMAQARAGIRISPQVIVILGAVVERYNFTQGRARPGYQLIAADTGTSINTITRALQEAERLGAVIVHRYKGRGLAAEIEFTRAVWAAPNLQAFAQQDREGKTPQAWGVLSAENPPIRSEKTPQTESIKPPSAGGPTVGSTVTETTDPPLSPPHGPKDVAGQLARLCVELGEIADERFREARRKIRQRLIAGTLAESIRAEIVARAQRRMLVAEDETANQAAAGRRFALAAECVDYVAAHEGLTYGEASRAWAETSPATSEDVSAALVIAPHVLRQRQAKKAALHDQQQPKECAYG